MGGIWSKLEGIDWLTRECRSARIEYEWFDWVELY